MYVEDMELADAWVCEAETRDLIVSRRRQGLAVDQLLWDYEDIRGRITELDPSAILADNIT